MASNPPTADTLSDFASWIWPKTVRIVPKASNAAEHTEQICSRTRPSLPKRFRRPKFWARVCPRGQSWPFCIIKITDMQRWLWFYITLIPLAFHLHVAPAVIQEINVLWALMNNKWIWPPAWLQEEARAKICSMHFVKLMEVSHFFKVGDPFFLCAVNTLYSDSHEGYEACNLWNSLRSAYETHKALQHVDNTHTPRL